MSGLVEVVCSTCGRRRSVPSEMRRRMAKRWRCMECRSKRKVLPKWQTDPSIAKVHDFHEYIRKNSFSCLVVLDPLERGGFKPGTEISRLEMASMIVNRAFTERTIVSDLQGRLYTYENGRMFKAGEKR